MFLKSASEIGIFWNAKESSSIHLSTVDKEK